MPSLAAALIASIGGWIIDAAIEPVVGVEVRILVGLVDGILIYYYARRWLVGLLVGPLVLLALGILTIAGMLGASRFGKQATDVWSR